VLKEYDLFVVADGMGGHRAGDVASKIATETISEFFRTTANEDVTWPFHFDTNLSEEENRLLTGIRVANRQIFERSTRSREYQGMGTTVVGAMFSPKKRRMYIGHVGDSRCYRVRSGQIQLLTRDHSLINDYLLAMPDLTDEQRSELPKNVITRARDAGSGGGRPAARRPAAERRVRPLLRRSVGHDPRRRDSKDRLGEPGH